MAPNIRLSTWAQLKILFLNIHTPAFEVDTMMPAIFKTNKSNEQTWARTLVNLQLIAAWNMDQKWRKMDVSFPLCVVSVDLKVKLIKGTPFHVPLTPPQLDSTHLDTVETINVSINTAWGVIMLELLAPPIHSTIFFLFVFKRRVWMLIFLQLIFFSLVFFKIVDN